jgi:hypothetical protein
LKYESVGAAESQHFKDFSESVIRLSAAHEKMAGANAPAMFRFRPAHQVVSERIAYR